MEAKELRIGNYIRKGVRCGKVTGSDIYELSKMNLGFNDSEYIKSWKPILLNEEWLLNFGFKKFVNDFSKSKIIIHTRKRGYVLRKSVPDIKYVHQLQNLYFALTGDELILINQ